MNHHTNTPNGSAMLILGLVAGATLPALFTPRNGEEMRDDIRRKMSDLKSNAKETKDELSQTAQETANSLKENVKRSKDRAKATIETDLS